MQQTSAAYKTEQKQYLREKSYVWVYLGVVDRTAQRTAHFDSSVTDWSKVPTGNEELEGVYATYEQNFFRADGKMMFPPETWAMYQGAASSAIGGAIKFAFDSVCDIRGISLKFFDDAIPLSFTISNGTVTYSYTYSTADVDEHGKWSCEDEFANSSYILITPITLKGGNQRFRIQQILFGKGFYFSDKDLLSTTFTNTVSHLSDKLPSKTFSFTVDNTNKKFAADDPHSFVHFLQEQQEVDFDYGRELPGGAIEKIKGGKLYLKTWSTDDQKATFDAVGYLEFMDSTYHKGHFRQTIPGGWFVPYTLYDMAEEVFADAGITNYSLDASLNDVIVDNPLPVEKHKNLLQLIANAGRCIFFEDRDGTFTIAPAYEGTVENVTDYTLEYKDLLTSPSAATTDFIKNVICQFYEYNIASESTEVGSISKDKVSVGDNFYIFSDAMVIDDVFYKDSPTVGTFDTYIEPDVPEDTSFTVTIDHGWITVTGDIEVVHEYYYPEPELVYNDVYRTLTLKDGNGNVLKTVSNTNSISYTTVSPIDIYLQVEYDTYAPVTVIEKGAYYIKFTTDHVSELMLMGRQVVLHTSEVSDGITGRNVGVDRTCKNILIDRESWAESNLDWMIDYYDDDIEYSVDYRGEPALDCDDVIYLDNQYVAKNYVRVTESTINTSQGMSKSTLKLRRSSYKDFARVDFAKVDDSEVK